MDKVKAPTRDETLLCVGKLDLMGESKNLPSEFRDVLSQASNLLRALAPER